MPSRHPNAQRVPLTRLLDQLASFTELEARIAALTSNKERERHYQAPYAHAEEGFKLGILVQNQRKNRVVMLSERRELMDALGFVWQARPVTRRTK